MFACYGDAILFREAHIFVHGRRADNVVKLIQTFWKQSMYGDGGLAGLSLFYPRVSRSCANECAEDLRAYLAEVSPSSRAVCCLPMVPATSDNCESSDSDFEDDAADNVSVAETTVDDAEKSTHVWRNPLHISFPSAICFRRMYRTYDQDL